MTKLTKQGKANKKLLYDWLKEHGYFKQFVNNLRVSMTEKRNLYPTYDWKKNFNRTLNDELPLAINHAFLWHATPEGHEHWSGIASAWYIHC